MGPGGSRGAVETFAGSSQQDAFLTALDAFEKRWQARISEGDDPFTLWEPSVTGAAPSVGVARGDGEAVRVTLCAGGDRPQWSIMKDGASVDLAGAARLLGLSTSLTQGILDAAADGLTATREAEGEFWRVCESLENHADFGDLD